ncbi:DUF3304 domain-containing protein [Burkholderia multivorans]|uniref:DUF3304 domain-containing protein n=1 Tax=Burkholderia multivorans TaxID=87883 RepID=UPI0005D898D6|nr:DUF3304 domain-containing protein [Burkholderia multivorans]AJY15329.1 hypothetical protein NP80_4686 [Burkholderia multivorans ATCC BAA-247]AVR18883.1 DUF3304 domain-containing protein [Burkholderia multivorans]MBU9493684.1 DUF3304 domain-containing protein [Burkholderia multivorans]MCO1438342.1 DUF3304 domain-containing protein [Burkholderia multivorans]MDN7508608.1 DUF3304 domain-containing protein [Burkholderia multivorans]
MIVLVLKRFAGLSIVFSLATILGCSDENESNPSELSGYNYTDYYITGFRVGSEGDEFPAGGPNIFPKKDGQMRSGGGGFVCCVSIPAHWHPGMKLVIKWRRDTKPYDKDRSGDQWLTATTEVPPYGPRTAGFVVHFLSGDRIRIQIRDERGILPEIDDDDPYIVQGVLDPGIEQETRRGR